MKFLLLGLSVFFISFATTIAVYTLPFPNVSLALKSAEPDVNIATPVVVENVVTPISEPEPVREPAYRPELLSWSLATTSAPWHPRDSATGFVFKDRMWIMGGLNGEGLVDVNDVVHYWDARHFDDVWSSPDGVNWKQEVVHAPWLQRRSMSVVEFGGSLWMFGGWSPIAGYVNDVWKSEDGIRWKQVLESAPWPAREGQTAEVFQGKIWMMGGVNYDERSVKNDVWYSEDGMTWLQATATIPWGARWDHATAVFNNKIFLSAGMSLSKETFRDVWSTTDGMNWELVTNIPPWQSRQGHSLVVFNNLLWTIGRLNDGEAGGVNDVWYSEDGAVWDKTVTDPLWAGREDHTALVFKNHLYVYGGMSPNWKWQNDVWVGE